MKCAVSALVAAVLFLSAAATVHAQVEMDGFSHRMRIYTPADQTVFASLVSEEMDSAVYPATYQIQESPVFRIAGNYSKDIQVSEGEAVNTSMEFISRYLPENLTVGLRAALPYEDYWPGSPQLILDYWPRWGLTLVSDSFRATIFVNAVTGTVVDAYLNTGSSALESAGFHRDSPLNKNEAERIAKDFLLMQNYTLPPDAFYSEIPWNVPWENKNYSFTHAICFDQYVQGVHIPWGNIGLGVESDTGLVTSFSYKWIDIQSVSTHGIISDEAARSKVLESLPDRSMGNIVDSILELRTRAVNSSETAFEMTLVYELTLVTTWGTRYVVDANTGIILKVAPLLDGGQDVLFYSPYARIVYLSGGCLLIALVGNRIARRRLLVREA
jgi:hypothetical protein